MIKLIWISDNENRGITFWFLNKFSKVEEYDDVKGKEVEKIIERESTDFLYLDLMRPANTDVINRLCLGNINRLRVSILKFHPFKFRVFKFLFPPEIIKTISHN